MDKKLFHDTVGAMMHLLKQHRYACENEIKNLGIHHSQHRMLMYIARCEQTVPTQVQIAQHFDISAAAVAVSLKKLEANGYIKRRARKNDLRNNDVIITQKGKKICDSSKNIFDEVDAKMFNGLSADDISLLKKYIDTMSKNFSKGEKE